MIKLGGVRPQARLEPPTKFCFVSVGSARQTRVRFSLWGHLSNGHGLKFVDTASDNWPESAGPKNDSCGEHTPEWGISGLETLRR
ncbi:MAG: hypothetical protein NZ739_02550, partial [Verrucomicrobiae bacterium]|nr:hypothetical protein [Verrucomicrobiae bacterium]